MSTAIQEYAKSLIYKNAYAVVGERENGLVTYAQFYKTYEEARKNGRDRGNDKYLYTFAQEIIIIPDDKN